MMNYKVYLTKDAVSDLTDLFNFIQINDSPQKAKYVLQKIEKNFSSLSEFPDRGTYPKELLKLGIKEYREIFFKPYRIIYRTINKNVYVLLIADGRRDMQSLFKRSKLEG